MLDGDRSFKWILNHELICCGCIQHRFARLGKKLKSMDRPTTGNVFYLVVEDREGASIYI